MVCGLHKTNRREEYMMTIFMFCQNKFYMGNISLLVERFERRVMLAELDHLEDFSQ